MNDELMAAAKIICTRLLGDTCVLVHNPDRPACTDENCKVWPVTRAALTAAAQVRERTEATVEQIMILDKIEQTSLGLFRSVRGADSDGIKTAMDAQQLILDYGRTFPRRPAALGIRKGE